MGIITEFSPELALKNISQFKEGKKKQEECIPENMKAGKIYDFLKKGQRVYWFNDDPFWGGGQQPLAETSGDGRTSRPVASIKMIEATHFLDNGELCTKGKYKVIKIFDINDKKIHFESCRRI